MGAILGVLLWSSQAWGTEAGIFEVAQPLFTGNELKPVRVALLRDVGGIGPDFESSLTATESCVAGSGGEDLSIAKRAGLAIRTRTSKPGRNGDYGDTIFVMIDARAASKKKMIGTYRVASVVQATVAAVRINARHGSMRIPANTRPKVVRIEILGSELLRSLGGTFQLAEPVREESLAPGE